MSGQTLSLIPHLVVDDPAAAIAFYVRAFGAEEDYRLVSQQGSIEHAELKLGTLTLMLAGEFPNIGCVSPKRHDGSSVSFTLTVEDVDGFVERAVAAGATLERPIVDEFYGHRVGHIRDPFGHRWSIHTVREHLTSAEIQQRYREFCS